MKKIAILFIAICLLSLSGLAMAAVNINSADAEALSQLPYIGESKSAAIIEEREAHGPFESVDDLTRVSGIGDKTVEEIRDQVTVGDDASSTADESADESSGS
ncbi:DNA transport competence protein [Salinisphaera sp. T5B8]|uniref:ComEA family DNA-binding protein n=1 Tax=Salinisphaera sp. T5B8 TaxID=1304154 RepID=UPI00333F0F32